MLKNKFISLFLFLIVTFTASFTGGILTIKFKDPWYSLLNKPFFNPPDWIFAPVWTILYFLMALAIWNIWIKSNKLNLVYLYFIHLIFNTTWSIVFFAFHKILISFVVLIILILLIILLITRFYKVNILSFYLMIPYLLWSSYALFLNFSLLILN